MSDLKKLTKDLRIDLDADISFDELKASLQQHGWSQEFPAILDEHGTVLVGNRRMKAAKALKIAPVTKTLMFGKGDAADAERIKLALISNLGVKPMTAKDRQHIAQHLYGNKQWTMQRIAEALNTTHKTISKDLSGFVPKVQTPRPKGGRPKEPPKPKPIPLTPEQRRAAQRHLDENVTMDKAAAEAGFSNTVMRRAKATVQAERETEDRVRSEVSKRMEIERAKAQTAREDMLQRGLKAAQAQINALRRDIKNLEKALTLSPQNEKRLQEKLRVYRARDRQMVKSQVAANAQYLEREKEAARRRSGAISDDLWEALIQCTHPDGNPSERVKTKAFTGLRDIEKILRATLKEANLKIVK